MMRQWSPTLDAALQEAVRMMRAEARQLKDSRGPKAQRMDKSVRRAIAASYDDWALVLEGHAQAIEAQRAETTQIGSVHESAVAERCAQGQSA